MTKYLFLFTITPVQSFVAEARKAQDFFVGSNELSSLTKCAIDKAEGCDIIFPQKPKSDDEGKNKGKEEGKISYPNRFMAFVDSENIKAFGDNLKKTVEEKFKTWVDKSWESFEKPKNYEDQRDNYLSITWVAVKYDKNMEDKDPLYYFKKYKEIESLLGGAKNIRDFKQLPDTEVGRKCSVCGERNALIFGGSRPFRCQEDSVLLFAEENKEGENKTTKYYLNQNGKTVEINSSKYYLMNDKEGLCAICAAKRFDEEAKKYPSTSEIALLYTLDQYGITGEDLKKCECQYLLMSLKDENNARNFEDIDKDQKKYTDGILTQIRSCKNKDKIPCTAYYALVAFDGDSMGETLGGGKFKKEEKNEEDKDDKKENKNLKFLKEFQGKLSEALGSFAKWVKEEGIAENEGRVVYAGGEDFFGFINLHYLFPVMTRLREKFDEKVYCELETYLKKKNNKDNPDNKEDDQKTYLKKLSFSAGITIAHVKTPLSVVIGKTREMEKKAKNRSSEKDAFAIAVMKHSGEINCIEMPWRNGDRFYMDDMQKLVDYMSDETLSNTFYQVLQTEFLPIVDESGIINEFNKYSWKIDEQYDELRKMLDCEIKRSAEKAVSLSERQMKIYKDEHNLAGTFSNEDKEVLKKKLVSDIVKRITDLSLACVTKDEEVKIKCENEKGEIQCENEEKTRNPECFDIVNFFHIFHIIDFIVRETGGLQ